MIYRKLGQSGFDVSALPFGLWQIGDSEYWGENDTGAQAIHAAIDGGVNLFDTAEVYGDGDSERVFGKWIGPNRDSVLIATKVSMSHCGVNDVRKACEGSLTRLNTDRIDLCAFESAASFSQAVFIERLPNGAVRTQPFVDLYPVTSLNKRIRQSQPKVVNVITPLPADLEGITEPAGGNQPRLRTRALNQGVRDKRRTVDHPRHVRRIHPSTIQEVTEPLKHTVRRVRIGSQCLCNLYRSRIL